MTSHDFVVNLLELYREARSVSTPFQRANIRRHRSHTVSSMAEDLLAAYLSDNLSVKVGGLEILVDVPLSFADANQPIQTIYPDIILVKTDSVGQRHIVSALDLKMDLGWNREFQEKLSKHVSRIQELCKIAWAKPGNTGEWLPVHPSLTMKFVIASTKNIGLGPLQKVRSGVAGAAPLIQWYELTAGRYLGHASLEGLTVNEMEFKRLLSDLEQDARRI